MLTLKSKRKKMPFLVVFGFVAHSEVDKRVENSIGAMIYRVRKSFRKYEIYIAYFLFVGYFVLRFIPAAWPKEISVSILGAMLLQIIFEIHNELINKKPNIDIFERFADAAPFVISEIRKLSSRKKGITIRYLGATGYHWQDIEPGLESILLKDKIENVTINMLILDDKWQGLSAISPAWKDQCVTTKGWLRLFSQSHRNEMSLAKWKFLSKDYKAVPQIWGVCIDDATLFLGHTYWDQVDPSEKKFLRGGANPMELIRSDDGRVGRHRIQDFLGWFDCYWGDTELPEVRLTELNGPQGGPA